MCREYKLYIPEDVFHVVSWVDTFKDMHSNRQLWDAPAPEVDAPEDEAADDEGDGLPPPPPPEYEERSFNLKVYAR